MKWRSDALDQLQLSREIDKQNKVGSMKTSLKNLSLRF